MVWNVKREEMEELTEAQKQDWRDKIDKMNQATMAQMQRYAPVGHPVFDNRSGLYPYFRERFEKLGGMTPGVSKAIGWG